MTRAVYFTALVSVCLLAGIGASCGKRQADEEAQPSVAIVKLGEVLRQDLDTSLSTPAAIFPREQASIASRTTAPIRSLRVKKGDTIVSGQLLAVIDDREAVAQRDDAQAQVSDAEATFQKTKSGTVPGDIEKARGQLQVAEAGLSQAQKNFERRSQLFSEGVIPNRDLLQSQTDLAQAKTNAEVAKRALDLLQRQSAANDIRSAQARLDSARARLDLAKTQLQYTEIRAPFGGSVTEQLMYPGDMATPGSPIFQIMDLAIVTARAQIPEDAAERVQRGQACVFMPVDPVLTRAAGKITVINRAVDPQRRTLEAWCEIRNVGQGLRGNVFGTVTITTAHLQNIPVIPVSAIQFQEGTQDGSVLVVDKGMLAHIRAVRAGEPSGNLVPVMSGLAAGERIVVEGGYGLADGTRVETGDGSSPLKSGNAGAPN